MTVTIEEAHEALVSDLMYADYCAFATLSFWNSRLREPIESGARINRGFDLMNLVASEFQIKRKDLGFFVKDEVKTENGSQRDNAHLHMVLSSRAFKPLQELRLYTPECLCALMKRLWRQNGESEIVPFDETQKKSGLRYITKFKKGDVLVYSGHRFSRDLKREIRAAKHSPTHFLNN
jgi:hypothetical protein